MTAAEILRTRLHHIALTVSDLDTSVRWYEMVFGVQVLVDEPHQGGLGRVLADESRSLMIVLHRHDANDGRPFVEQTTGLDHVGFQVPSRDELQAWQDHLEHCGVRREPIAGSPLTQSPIVERPYGAVLVFRDPDNIQLEIFSPSG